MDGNKLIDATQAAKLFGIIGKKISVRTVYNYMEKHGLPFELFGKNTRLIRREDVLNFVRPKWGRVGVRKPAQ